MPAPDRPRSNLELQNMAYSPSNYRQPPSIGTERVHSHGYAEFDPHLGPQATVLHDLGAADLPPPSTLLGAGNHEDPGFKGNSRTYRSYYWLKKRPYLAAAIVTGLIGLICLIVLPIVLHNLSQKEDDITPPHSQPVLTSTTTPSPSHTHTSSTTSPTAVPTEIPQACLSTAAFTPGVSFMGIRNGVGWQWASLSPKRADPTSCCAACFALPGPKRCNSWSWNPVGNSFTPCIANYGWDRGERPDETCPGGYAPVYFETKGDKSKAFGGAGPCGVV